MDKSTLIVRNQIIHPKVEPISQNLGTNFISKVTKVDRPKTMDVCRVSFLRDETNKGMIKFFGDRTIIKEIYD